MCALYMSGYADEAVGRRGVRAKEIAFLAKSLTTEMLVKKLPRPTSP